MCTLHCALENGADLYVNEREKIRQYHAMSTEERRRIRRRKEEECKITIFYFALYAYANLQYNIIAMLYTHSVVFKMCDSVPSTR